MHVTGSIVEPQYTKEGRVRLVLEVNEKQKALEEMERLKDKKLAIDIDVFREHRSNDANAYFWQLVDKIAKVLRSEKWAVYLLELSRYGVFSDVSIPKEGYGIIQNHFRYTEILKEDEAEDDSGRIHKRLIVRCFYGSSDYNTKEMSDLIAGTVEDAKAIGIETLTPDEISRLLAAMEGKK